MTLYFQVINCQSIRDKDLFKIKFYGNVETVQEFEYSVDNNDSLFKDKHLINYCPMTLKYDRLRRLKYSEYCNCDIVDEYNYIYDKKGRVIQEKNSLSRNENIYDKDGNLIEHRIGIDKNSSFGKWTYKYDNKKNQIERIGFISGDFVERWIHKYDTYNNRIAEIMVGQNEDSDEDEKLIFEYNSKRQITHQIYISYGPNSARFEYMYKYDRYNNLIESKEIDNYGKVQITINKYKFDRMNNWIEKYSFVNGLPSQYFRRKIKYYN